MLNRLIAAILALALALPARADAQMVGAFVQGGAASGGGAGSCSYPLPLGSDTVASAYSFRKLISTYSGYAVNLVRASDSTNMNIGFAANNCDFDSATAATFCASTTCVIATWYDQTANAVNVTQSTASLRPTYSASCLSGKPCATLTSSPIQGWTATYGTGVAADSIATVGSFTGNASGSTYSVFIGSSSSNATGIGYSTTSMACDAIAFASAMTYKGTGACTFGTSYRQLSIVNNSTSSLYVSGTLGTPNSTSRTVAASTALYIGNGNNTGTNGTLEEVLIFSPDISAADGATLGANQATYWGVP